MAIAGAVRSNEVKRIPLCHIHFAGQTRHGGLEYNELGQLLVVCDWNLYILTPSIGFLPAIKPDTTAQSAVTYDQFLSDSGSATAAGPSSSTGPAAKSSNSSFATPLLNHYLHTVPVSTLRPESDRTSFQHRPLTEHDYEAAAAPICLHASLLCFKTAKWSPKGLGPMGSCVLATVDSDLDIRLLHAKGNAYKGPYTILESLNAVTATETTLSKRRHTTLGSQVLDIAWSPDLMRSNRRHRRGRPSSLCILAAAARSGEVLLWTRWRSKNSATQLQGQEQAVRVQVARRTVTAVYWSGYVDHSAADGGAEMIKLSLLAIVPGRGPKFIEVRVRIGEGGEVDCIAEGASVQPPNLRGAPEVTLLRAERGRADEGVILVAATAGQVHIWRSTSEEESQPPPSKRARRSEAGPSLIEDAAPTGGWISLRLLGEHEAQHELAKEWDERSPHARATSLEKTGEELRLTLASGLQYLVPLTDDGAAGKQRVLVPEESKATTVLVPRTTSSEGLVLESLLQQVEARRNLPGWAADDSGDQEALQIRAAIQSDDDIKAYRSLLNHKSRCTMMLQLPASADEAQEEEEEEGTMGHCASLFLQAVRHSLANDDDHNVGFRASRPRRTTIHALRPALSIYYAALMTAHDVLTASDISVQLLSALRTELSSSLSPSTSPPPRLVWLTYWALRELKAHHTPPALVQDFEAMHLRLVVARLVETLVLRAEKSPLVLAMARAVRDVLQSRGGANWRTALAQRLEKVLGRRANSAPEAEVCPACSAPIPLPSASPPGAVKQSSSASPDLPPSSSSGAATNTDLSSLLLRLEQARCENGHLWKRCSVTFAVLAGDMRVRSCVGCGAKEAGGGGDDPEEGDQGERVEEEDEEEGEDDTTCRRCGNGWILLS